MNEKMIIKHNGRILAILVNLYVAALKNTENTPMELKNHEKWDKAKYWEYAVMDVITEGWIDENEKKQ